MPKSAFLRGMRLHLFFAFASMLFWSFSGFSARFYIASGGLGADVPGGGGVFNPLASVSFAISQAVNGDTIIVLPGAYQETDIVVNKRVRIFGNESGSNPGIGVRPVFDGSSSSTGSVFIIQATDVEIRNLEIRVDQVNVLRGIFAAAGGFNRILISGNRIVSTNTNSASVFGSYGILLGQNTSPAGADSSLIVRNIIVPADGAATFGRAIRLNGGFSTIGGTDPDDGNTLTGDYGIQYGSAAGGTARIQNNIISAISAGIEFNNPTFAGNHLIEGNAISTISGRQNLSMIEIKNHNKTGSTLTIRNNNLTNFYTFGIFSSKSSNVFVQGNTFTPADTARNFICLAVNTKQQTTSTSEIASASSISITGNNFLSAGGFGGTAIAFQNHFSGVTPPFQNVVIGGEGTLANTFGLFYAKVCELDARTGPSTDFPLWNQTNYPVTQMLPAEADFDLSKNLFDLGTGPKLPSSLSGGELMALEDRIQHQVDFDSLGFVTVIPNRVFVTAGSAVFPKTTTPSINRGLAAATSDGWSITASPLEFSESVSIDKNLIINSEPAGEIGLASLTMNGSGKTLNLQSNLLISNTLLLGAGKIDLGSSNLSLASTASSDAGSETAYVVTSGSGRFLRKGLTSEFTYPIGTSLVYTPTKITNTGIADDVSLRVQNDVLSGGLTGAPVDSVVGITWVINEGTAGGSSLNVVPEWPGSAEKTGFSRSNTFLQGFAGSWVNLSGSSAVAATGSDPYTASYSGVSGNLTDLPLRISGIGATPPPPTESKLYYVSATGGDNNRTAAEAKNPSTPWASIGKALSSLGNGDSVQVLAGTYNENNLTFNKSIHLLGNLAGVGSGAGAGTGEKPVVNGTSSLGDRAIFVLQSTGSEIRNFEIRVDQDSVLFGIKGPDPGFSGALITDNLIQSTKTGVASVFGTYGIILGQTFSNATNDSSTILRNTIVPAAGAAMFGRAIRLNGGSTVIGGSNPADGNTLQGDYGIQFGSPRGKASLILNNTISAISAGVEFNNPVVGGVHRIAGNKISPVSGRNAFSMIEVKNHNLASSTLEIDGNEFSGFMINGIFSSKSKNVVVKNNIFTPADTARNFVSLAVNTKQQTTSQSEPASFSSISIIGNQFNAGTQSGGTAIAFQNHFSGVNPPFQNVVVGGDGPLANKFAANIGRVCELDARSGASNQVSLWNQTNYRVTTMLPVEADFDLSANQFDMGSGLKTPAEMTVAERMSLEDHIQHQIDFDSLGFVSVVDEQAFVTSSSFLAPRTTEPAINRAYAEVSSDDWIITAAPGTYNEVLAVDSSLTLASEPSGVIALNSISMENSGKVLSLQTGVLLSGDLSLNAGKVDLVNSDLTLEPSATSDGGSPDAYVITSGSGKIIRKNLGGSFVFPVGTPSAFAPTSITNSGAADDLGIRVQEDVLSGGLSGQPVDSVVGITWVASESTPGGSDLSIAAQWPGSSEKNGFNRTETYFQAFAGGVWTNVSGSQPVAAAGSDPFTATYSGITGALDNLPLRIASSGETPPPPVAGNLYYVSTSTGSDSRSAEEAKNPATPWQTIGKALASVADGDSVQVLFGIYNESNLSVDKAVQLFGNVSGIGTGSGAGTGVRPVINGTTAGTDSALFLINSPGVLFRNFQMEVDQLNIMHGIYAKQGNYNNLRVLDSRIYSTGTGSLPCVKFNSYGIRLLDGSSDSLIVKGTDIEPKVFTANCAFGRGIRIFGGGRLVAGGPAAADTNRIVGLYGVQLGDLAGSSVIENNTFLGQGIEITAPAAGSGIHKVINNRILAVLPSFFTTLVEFKDVQADGSGILMEGNLVSGHSNLGVLAGRSKNVTIRNNIFEPSAAAADTNFIHIYVNTKQVTRATEQSPALNEITIQGNELRSGNGKGGTGIQFANHNDDPANGPAFGNVVLGGADTDANRFGQNLRAYLRLDANSGPSNTISPWQTLPVTTMAPVEDDFNLSDNLFSINGSEKRPNEMDMNELLQLEDGIQHGIDFAGLGFVKVVNEAAFVTENSFLSPITGTASLQRAVNLSGDNWTINIRNSSIDEVVRVDKNLTFNTHPADSMLLGGIAMNGQGGVVLTLQDNFHLTDSLILNVQDGGKISIGNNNLIVRSGTVVTEGNDNSYVRTDGNGNLVIRNVQDQPVTFPVGTTDSYAPVTFDDANATGDNFLVRVAPAATGGDFTPALPPSITTFAQFQWTICEREPGGSNASLTFDWRNSANVFGVDTLNALVRNESGNWIASGASISLNQTATADGISSFCAPFAVVASGDLELVTGNPIGVDGQVKLDLCPGDTIQVPFTASGPFNGNNQFILQLSDADGSFAAGAFIISITPLDATSSDTITGVIPVSISAGANYRVRVRATSPDTAGLANADSIQIFTLPLAPLVSGDSSFCLGETVNLISSVAENISWAPGGQTNDSIQVSNAGIFTVTVTDNNGCSATSLPFETSVNLPPVADTISYTGSLVRCAGNTIQLTANPAGFSYLWSNGVTGQSISSDTSGTFSVIVSNAEGCSDTTASLSVIFNPLPQPVVSGGNGADTICQPGTLTLSTTAAFNSNTWLGTGISPDPTTPTVSLNTPGNYQIRVLVTDANGCSDTSEVRSKVIFGAPSASDITFTPALTACAGDTIILTANPDGLDYLWTTGNAADTLRSFSATASGNYSVVVINEFGCTDTSALVSALFNPLPAVPLIELPSDTVCTPAVLNYSTQATGGSLIWSGTGINPEPTGASAQITAPGFYTVTVKITDANSCSRTSDPVTGLIRQAPGIPAIIPVGSGLTRCADDTLVLAASPFFAGNVYTWNSDPAGIVINGSLNLVAAGSYAVQMTVDSNFCSVNAAAPVTAVLNALPQPVITSSESDNRVCLGESVTLSSNFNEGNLWIGPAGSLTSQEITLTASVSSVVLQVTDGNGCVNTTAPLEVIVDPLPLVSMRKDSAYSFNDDVLLEAVDFSSNVSNFEWFRGTESLGNSGTTPSFSSPAQTTSVYSVIITDVNGCQSRDSIQVRVSDEVFIPNSFSPNKDGKNDYFKVFGFGVKEIQFQIWDRFGNLIYESSDPGECVESGRNNDSAKGWNGEYKGKVLQQGSFIWTIKGKFNSGQDLKVTGGNNSGSVILLN